MTTFYIKKKKKPDLSILFSTSLSIRIIFLTKKTIFTAPFISYLPHFFPAFDQTLVVRILTIVNLLISLIIQKYDNLCNRIGITQDTRFTLDQ